MSPFQEYKEKRRIEALGLPKIWVVYSDRKGVKEPIEHQVIHIFEGNSFILSIDGVKLEEPIAVDRYKIAEAPYEINFERGKTYSLNAGYGSGCGDLWAWSYFSCLSKEEADTYYLNEVKRVKEKYAMHND